MNNSATSIFRLSYRTKSIIILFLMACGPMPFDYDEFKSFFMPEIARGEQQFHSYNFTSQFLYGEDLEMGTPSTDIAETENTKAWAAYAGIEEKAVSRELYPEYGNKSTKELTAALKKKGLTAAEDYLRLARDIEVADVGSEEANTPSPDYSAWLNNIETRYEQAKDNFIKERLAYQAVKVADMAGQPQKSIELYDKLVKSLSQKTFISDWAYSRMAGATVHAGDSAKAYYHFSQIFVNAPSRRKAAYISLKSYLPKLKDEALAFCKTNAEKANVYAATAILPFQDALPMMEKIRELDVNSPLLEFVTAREINKNEEFFFNNWEDLKYSFWNLDSLKKENLKKNAPDYFTKLLAFTLKSAENPSLKQSPFWYTAASYLAFIAKDYKKAQEFLDKAASIPTDNKHAQDQIELQRMVLTVTAAKVITPEIEASLIPQLERFSKSDNFRVANNFNAVCKMLAARYRGQSVTDEFAEGSITGHATSAKQSESKPLGWFAGCFGKKENAPVYIVSPESQAKAFLVYLLTSYQLGYTRHFDDWTQQAVFMSSSDQYVIEDSTSSATIGYTLDYFARNNTTDFDKRLMKLTGIDQNYLYTVLGRRALAEHQYTKTAEAWQHIQPAAWASEPFNTYLDVNPFRLEKLGEANAKQKVTPLSFAKRMAELEENVRKNPNDYQSWLLLGCGSYNMGYYGNSWILQRRAWSGGETKNEKDDYYTAEKALYYFDKAMNTAPDKETAAKACYLAAACQKIRYELVYNSLYDNMYLLPDEAREAREKEIKGILENLRTDKYATYFNLLKTKYQDSDYESQLINECSTYKDFLTGK